MSCRVGRCSGGGVACSLGNSTAAGSTPRPHHFDFPLAKLRQCLVDQRFGLSLANVRILLPREQCGRPRWDREQSVPDRDLHGRQGMAHVVDGDEPAVQFLRPEFFDVGLRLEQPGIGRSGRYPRRQLARPIAYRLR